MDKSDNGLSIIREHQKVIIDTIKNITRGDWKVLVLDATTKQIIDNTVKEDDILNQNIANIELIEDRREPNPTMDAIYFLSPQQHILECLLTDFERRRYRKAFIVWAGVLNPELGRRLQPVRQQIAAVETLLVDFFPRESHLITFRDPWSFPVLYHPGCNDLIAAHMKQLAQKIAATCITLGEYPKVRYYKPSQPIHEASVLCGHLARFVQKELDGYKEWDPEFPRQTGRPQGVLLITDRSMDLMAPLIHEFTYQAMAHDLLPLNELPKVTFHMTINEGTATAEEKDMEITEADKVWVENRHRHMKDTIDKLMGDFQRFLQQNPNFTDQNQDTTSLNAIRDMMAGLPQFQQMKEAYSLHLTMAQEAMNVFQRHKLPDIASTEQTLATGVDEDFRKPKNVLDQVVRLLDDEAITKSDRLRLIALYVLYRDGVIEEDIRRLLAHASLPPSDEKIITNLAVLGAQPTRPLKGFRQPPPPLFPINTKTAAQDEEYALSRFEPAVKHMLEELCRGQLDHAVFPHTVPPANPNEDVVIQGSLRTAGAPRWASANRRQAENRQRIIVFVAGGATFSEARACYEVSEKQNRDVFLATTHMVSPALFIRQVGDLSVDRRRLDLPMDRPKPRAPAHLFERSAPPQPPPLQRPAPPPSVGSTGSTAGSVRPPTKALGAMTLSSGGSSSSTPPIAVDERQGRLSKDKDKKKRNIFGLKK
ncbi:Sec1-like protein [Lasiosphaeris hirsuta]|uniref:Sec1-like protein n=1 Tax=Lasiosphaeris hirsuta TaxID=260670 RepID=A0AA40AH70_9PEZI|nr:Sec1-like protein [Lasiosphaeris hirsuta]